MTKKKKTKRDGKKQRIEALCRQVLRGDVKAEKELKSKLNSPRVKEIVENFVREDGGANVSREASTIRSHVKKGKGQFTKGNAFKPYQGGLPSLGKKP